MPARDKIRDVARDKNVRLFRAFLAEPYDGIGQYVAIALSRGSISSALRARVASGDIASGTTFPKGTPVAAFSYHGQIEILSLGSKPQLEITTIPVDPPGPGEEPSSCDILECFNNRTLLQTATTDEFIEFGLGATAIAGLSWESGSPANAWIDIFGPGSGSVEIGSGIFRFQATGDEFSHAAHLVLEEPLADGSIDLTFRIRLGSITSGDWSLLFRLYGDEGGGQVESNIFIDPTTLSLGNVTGGGGTQIDDVPTPLPTNDAWYVVRWERVEGSVSRVKVWEDGDAEPGSWLLELDITASGAFPGGDNPSLLTPFFGWSMGGEIATVDISVSDLDVIGFTP